MAAATLEAPAETTTVELTKSDRCCRCGAQAYVRALIPAADDMDILFCGHHFRDHEPKLISIGATIQDERHKINDRPSVSANV